jgi:hypothetical protein
MGGNAWSIPPSRKGFQDRHAEDMRPIEAVFQSILCDHRQPFCWDQLERDFRFETCRIKGHAIQRTKSKCPSKPTVLVIP